MKGRNRVRKVLSKFSQAIDQLELGIREMDTETERNDEVIADLLTEQEELHNEKKRAAQCITKLRETWGL